ncbi:Eco57I restriction-modification methylase domain-containing protein [Halomicrococcus sp. NG-SE-24]|uniref:Eco57I restriction-modification methylase domain-containing protein n=1 Tax=Halomicrococcus sp. NG-SE-24 TaxID=3436928 RepID=UPI003D97B67A
MNARRRRRITARDVAGWDDLDAVVETLGYRGLDDASAPELTDDQRNALAGADVRFLELAPEALVGVVEAAEGRSPTDYEDALGGRFGTALVTDDYRRFTFLTRERPFRPGGRVSYRRFAFEKRYVGPDGGRFSVLDRLNGVAAGDPTSVRNLYVASDVVEAFHRAFASLRADLTEAVSGVTARKAGDAKRRYVQVLFDRLLFLQFVQAKGLLDGNRSYLLDRHALAESTATGVAETFYGPLFGVLAGADDDVDASFFEDDSLPSLDCGLFAPTAVERANPDVRLGDSVERENALYRRVLEFLDEWRWRVDELAAVVEPKTLSPSILGHIFEQTVDRKEMGAYYTPDEITEYMAQEAIYPRLLDDLNERIDGHSYESLDRALDDGTHLETLYADVVRGTKVLDPAVGSGAFLLAAQRALLDVSLRCIDGLRERYSRPTTGDPPETVRAAIERPPDEDEPFARRTIVRENLYGVDVDAGAVETCKLRLWLSTLAAVRDDPDAVEPLPSLDSNLRTGNALIGLADADEDALGGRLHECVAAIADRLDAREAASGREAAALGERAETLLDECRRELDERVLAAFRDAGVDAVDVEAVRDHDPFHWPVEFARAYRDGWFDVVVGNPPWDRIRPTRDDFFSQYDESFRSLPPAAKDDRVTELLERREGLRAEYERFEREHHRLAEYFRGSDDYELQQPAIDGRTRSTDADLSALFLERVYRLAREDTHVALLLPGNVFTGLATKDLRTRLLDRKRVESILGFENKGTFDDLHDQYKFGVVAFENSGETDGLRGVFGQTDLTVLRELRNGRTDRLLEIPRAVLADYSPIAGLFPMVRSQAQVDVLDTVVDHPPVSEPDGGSWYADPYRELDRTQDADRFVETADDGDYPVLGGASVYRYAYDDRVHDLEPPRFWSVDDGSAASARRRVREKGRRTLKRELYEFATESDAVRERYGVRATGSMRSTVDDLLEAARGEPLRADDVRLDCTEYRIVYRDVAQPTDERTMIAAVIPPGPVCHNKLHTVRPFEIVPSVSDLAERPLHGVYERVFTDEELFAALGLLNSVPFDYLMRTKVDKSVVMYKFRESQVPHLTRGDDYFEAVWRPAAQLNCYGEPFAEMRRRLGGLAAVDPDDEETRREKQARVDAAAFHAYGFDGEEVEFVLEDFHRVTSPRVMDEDYFAAVEDAYYRLQ